MKTWVAALLTVTSAFFFQACNKSAERTQQETAVETGVQGKVMHNQLGSCDTASNSGIYLKLDLWKATDSSAFAAALENALTEKTIRKINAFGDSSLIAGNPAALRSVRGAFEIFENNYKSFNKSNPDAPGCWMLELKGDTIMTTSKLLCYTLFEVSFVGGAHPNSFRSFHVFDKKTGEEWPMERFVTDSVGLVKVVEKKFKEVEKLAPDADLDKSGYFLLNNRFALPVSYVFVKEGVRFYYNPYEIAPYARGAIDFTIPYAELKGLVDTSLIN